jgi:hypothetical protein
MFKREVDMEPAAANLRYWVQPATHECGCDFFPERVGLDKILSES